MKTLAFILFLMNIGFYIWLQGLLPWLPWQPELYESKPQPVQLSENVERLVLVAERNAPETIPLEEMRLADERGILEDENSKTLEEEAKISIKEDATTFAEDEAKKQSTTITTSNLRTASAVNRLLQLPKTAEKAEEIEEIEEIEGIEEIEKEIKADELIEDEDNAPSSTTVIDDLESDAVPKNSSTKNETLAKISIPTTVEMAQQDVAPVAKSEQVSIAEKAEKTTPSKPLTTKQAEQPANDFFSRLAQSVKRVGNSFTRISSDVFNERITVPPELAESEQPTEPTAKPEMKPETHTVKIAATAPAKQPINRICYEIGSYSSISQLNEQANWLKLQSKQIKTYIDKKTLEEVDKIRVYIAPNAQISSAQQRLIAQNIVMRLRHDGISDMRLMSPNSALKNSISLGVFDSYNNALRRANMIKSKGYANVRLKKYYRKQTKYWLIAKMPETQQNAIDKFKNNFKQVQIQPCR